MLILFSIYSSQAKFTKYIQAFLKLFVKQDRDFMLTASKFITSIF